MKLACILLLTAVSVVICIDKKNISTVFTELELVPDILSEPPDEFLEITYPEGVQVDGGNELTPSQVKDEPILEYATQTYSYYTIIMTCPDAPNRKNPVLRDWLHWLLVNVPGTCVEQGEVLCPYIGAATPKSSGLSRYLFLVYKQPEYMVFDETALNDTSPEGHSNFDTLEFSMKYGLGAPIAGNVFQARWDEYVPILQKQLNIEV